MHVTEDHWLSAARRCLSPNQNERPAGVPVSLLVVHGISLPPGDFGGPYIDALFTNSLNPSLHPYFQEVAGLTVSAHLLVRRDGEIVQYVPFDRRAWHAGQSCYADQMNCNDFSIGIELEGTDDIPYTEIQYRTLAAVLSVLERHYPETRGHLVGHSDIAPGRKTDPGPSFDWHHLHALRGKEQHG